MKKKYMFVFVMLLTILIAGMGMTNLYVKRTEGSAIKKDTVTIVTSFYPMYIAAQNLTEGIRDVELENLSEPQTGCLHDFQLTPEDMKLLSTADIFVINGGGIESFMEEIAEAYPKLKIVEATKGVELLPENAESEDAESEEHEHEDAESEEHEHEDAESEDHEHHHHDSDVNAHAWMSVACYEEMVMSMAQQLAEADSAHGEVYLENAQLYVERLEPLRLREQALQKKAAGTDVILFHAAYEYVADALEMQTDDLLDLDEERQISAGEVADVLAAIQEHGVSLILAEELYGRNMAETIQKEASVTVIYLDPLTRGAYEKDAYIDGMSSNLSLLENYFD